MKKTKTYVDSKQTMWETWFVISLIIFGAYFFVGTLENSMKEFPNWIYFMLLSTFNLLICIIIGCYPRKE